MSTTYIDNVPGGSFGVFVLACVTRLGTDAYGMRIVKTLSDKYGKSVAPPRVYQTLGALEKKGFVKSFQADPDPHTPGRPKRMYSADDKGAAVMEFLGCPNP